MAEVLNNGQVFARALAYDICQSIRHPDLPEGVYREAVEDVVGRLLNNWSHQSEKAVGPLVRIAEAAEGILNALNSIDGKLAAMLAGPSVWDKDAAGDQ